MTSVHPSLQEISLEPEAGASGPGGGKERMWPDLGQIASMFDISHGALWSFMEFKGRPSYNPGLLADFHGWQDKIAALSAEVGPALKYVVLGSRHASIFCLGGDLDYFTDCIEAGDRERLAAYGRSCITILHRNWRAIDSKVITIGLAQGDALGGGFESLLSFDILCAERGTKFGFPEQLFGLFPGMGALSFLGRQLGFAKAEQMVRSGQTVTAEELYQLGVVHLLAEKGQGIETVQKYIAKNGARHRAEFCLHQAAKRANPIPFEELDDIVGLWADACLGLEPRNIAIMQRLAAAQIKLSTAA